MSQEPIYWSKITPEQLSWVMSVYREQGLIPDLEADRAQRTDNLGDHSEALREESAIPRL